MAFIIEETRPAFRIAETTSRSGEPPDAISTMAFRPSGGRIGLLRAIGARRTRRKRGQTDGPKEVSWGTSCRSRSPKKSNEPRTLVVALYEKSVALAQRYSICRLKAPLTAPPSSSQTGEEARVIKRKPEPRESFQPSNDKRTAPPYQSKIPLQPRGKAPRGRISNTTREGGTERVHSSSAHFREEVVK